MYAPASHAAVAAQRIPAPPIPPPHIPADKPVKPISSAEYAAQAVKRVNEAFSTKQQNLQAFIEKDPGTGINVVKIQDKTTQEVIGQFPPKAIIAMAEAINLSLDKKGLMLKVNA